MEKQLKSRITTEKQLMALQPNDVIYIVDRLDVKRWKCLTRMPYKTMERMAFYDDTNFMSLSAYQLERIILTDHDEAYESLVNILRAHATSIEEIYLNKK